MLAIGLMSGTSLDGVDAALVELDGDAAAALSWRLLAFRPAPYSREQRDAIHAGIVDGDAASLCELNANLGEWFADAALALLRDAGREPDEVDVIGSHGQTVWHSPPEAGRRGATLQLGCAATIAERTGIPVVSDFRSRDVAAGGHGAPLVPWVDRTLFAHPDRTRVLLNLGGIGNLTRVPPRGSDEPLLAFDTGPGNALIDAAMELATGGAESYDRDGGHARAGSVLPELLAELMDDDYLRRDPPKSTGRERYGRPRAREIAERVGAGGSTSWDDVVATLTAFTAASVADAVERWVLPRGADELVVTGGGARNPRLMELLAERLAPLPIDPDAALADVADAKEAIAFAALAWAHLNGVPAGVPEVTGAAGPRVLGSLTPGRAGR